jgi:hypothetical protein
MRATVQATRMKSISQEEVVGQSDDVDDRSTCDDTATAQHNQAEDGESSALENALNDPFGLDAARPTQTGAQLTAQPKPAQPDAAQRRGRRCGSARAREAGSRAQRERGVAERRTGARATRTRAAASRDRPTAAF